MKGLLSLLAAGAAITSSGVVAQDADALIVYSSNGVRAVLQELQPEIEAAAGRRLAFDFSTSRTLTDRIAAGEPVDVAILTPALIDELIASQRVDPGSRAVFAQVGVGVGARAGTAPKSVRTLEDLRQTLLEAESVAYGASGQSRRTNETAFEALGISEEMRGKSRLTGPGEGPVRVAEGEVELVLTLVSELLREPGVQFLGPLPPEVQGYIQFAAAVGATARDPVAGRALIDFLFSPRFVTAMGAHGLAPIGR